MTHTAIRTLRRTFDEFQQKKDIEDLVKSINTGEKSFEPLPLNAEKIKTLRREDLHLVCFDFVWSG